DLSVLGFGCMRLPVTGDGNIDEPEATGMIRYAIDHGVNYIDTAYPYHAGESEPFVGRALSDGYRERVNLATKLPGWLITSREDMDRYLNEQLLRLRTDHVDFYLLHGLMKPLWDTLSSLRVTEFLDDAIADGRIRYAGFSFHDELPVFWEITDSYDWTFCQIQYNFMDDEYQAGTEGLRYAAGKKLGVVVMEPIRGGMLAGDVLPVRAIWEKATVRRTPAEWALRWVWNHPEVTVVLSGMSTRTQVEQNVAFAEQGNAGSLREHDLSLFAEVKAEYKDRIKIPCTGCAYCQPCQNGVDIPACFEEYNHAHMYGTPDIARTNYSLATGGFFGPASCASLCQQCGECEEKCPQGIPIREKLKEVAGYFGR
ncbi:MAG: aldo/keto reductase, partial [Methanoregulaceae archaeon]|nr:aldo/keto reductase [Methanoregulaceae archaeon]